MNYVNASVKLHEVESNYYGKISHVPKSTSKDSKSAFYAKLRQTRHQGTHPFVAPNAAGEAPALISAGTPVAREDERTVSTIPMPTFARKPPTMSSFILVDIPQSSMVGQQRQADIGTSI